MLRQLRAVSIVESLSYLALLAAMAWHRLLNGADATPVVGLVHGVIYLVYAAVVLVVQHRRRWPAQQTVLALFMAAVPLGGFWVAHRVAGSGTVGPLSPSV
ncbi:MAG: DUF3817 domain-containing protein [Acidimicrobiales bacterium]